MRVFRCAARWATVPVTVLVAGIAAGLVPAFGQPEDPAERTAWLAERLRSHIERIDARAADLMAPEFPEGKDWFNAPPLRLAKELSGKITVLDFWTYCCINCIHVLPDLAYLEEKYAGFPVAFVGVHSAKFDNEKLSENIRQAVLRYDIRHPVINDDQMAMWRQLGVRSWPSLAVVGPKGNRLLMVSGEGNRELLDVFIATALEFYPPEVFAHDPLPIRLEQRAKPSPLRFPGKLAVDAARGLLYISDSNHHRIVVTTLAGAWVETIGSGRVGLIDGSYDAAAFHRLQGLALDGDQLWVADAENHALRRVDLTSRRVHTVLGDGRQGRDPEGGRTGLEQQLSTPWDVVVDGDFVYIAMAGTHQVWAYHKGADQGFAYSGTGHEQNQNAIDPKLAAWAQPSGLTIGSGELFVADSESSSIRALSLANGVTRTIAGGDDSDPRNLFAFGDVDGEGDSARLQHPLGVLWVPRLARVAVADTYNHRLKLVDPEARTVVRWIGSGEPGLADGSGLEARFDEPSGFALGPSGETIFVADTNNHAIRVVHVASAEVRTLAISGVPEPASAVRSRSTRLADLPGTPRIQVAKLRLAPGARATLRLRISLPHGHEWLAGGQSRWQLLDEPDSPVRVDDASASGALGAGEIEIPITARDAPGSGAVRVEALGYYCQKEAACQVSGVVFEVPVEIAADAEASSSPVELAHELASLGEKLGAKLGELRLPGLGVEEK